MSKLKLLILLMVCPVLVWYSVGEDNEGVPKQASCTTHTITKVEVKWFPEWALAHEIATYTYNKYGLDYLLLLKAENGTFEPERRHNGWTKHCVKGYDEETQRRIPAKYDKENKRCYWTRMTAYDYWLCWFNEYRHPESVYNENFHNRQWQVDRCVELKKWGTAFYWWNSRYKNKNSFIFTEVEVCD